MGPGRFRDYVETVRGAMDIVQVVGEAVSLRKAGRSLVGLCPFHQEKTPSFHVDAAKGVYYCFGCGAGGDAFRFVMNLHNVDFSEAVGMIGDRLGLARPAAHGATAAQDAKEDRERRRALDALAEAQEYFGRVLAGTVPGTDAAAARAYLARRGFDLDKARAFGIGLSPSGWDGLLRHLVGRGFQVDDAIRAGLAVPRTSGEGAYDRFRYRVTFPIRDAAGRIVSFGGRALGDEDPKYLNGPETQVYDKGRTLFRLHETAREIRDAGRAVIVEGYFDAVGLAAAGVPGVVAVCGTAFGPAHARLLRRYSERVVLLFDGDSAGRRAVHRALGPLLAEGFAVRIGAPPDGKDPDDLAREGGSAAVEACLAGAGDLPQYLVTEAKRDFDLVSLDGRVKALEMVLSHLCHLDSPLARAEAASRVAEGLGIDDELVRDELRRAARDRRRDIDARAARPLAPSQEGRLTAAEKVLIRYLVEAAPNDGEEADRILDEVPLDSLSPAARPVLERWAAARRAGEWPQLPVLAGSLAGPETTDILALVFAPGSPPGRTEARGAVAALRGFHLRDRLRRLQQQIQDARDPGEIERLLVEKAALGREMHAIGGPA